MSQITLCVQAIFTIYCCSKYFVIFRKYLLMWFQLNIKYLTSIIFVIRDTHSQLLIVYSRRTLTFSSSTDSKSIRESEMQINEHKKCHQYKLNVICACWIGERIHPRNMKELAVVKCLSFGEPSSLESLHVMHKSLKPLLTMWHIHTHVQSA